MSDKLLNELFSRERLWSGLTLPTLSATQNSQACPQQPLKYNDQFYTFQSGLLGNQEFQYHPLSVSREGKLVDQLPVYAGGSSEEDELLHAINVEKVRLAETNRMLGGKY